MSESINDLVPGTKNYVPNVENLQIDSRDIGGDDLDNRVLVDTLAPGSFTKLPEAIEWVIKKFDDNPQLVSRIEDMLKQIVSHYGKMSMDYELFTKAVPVPKGLDIELLKIMGLSAEVLKKSATQIGFNAKHNMHMDTYYLTLAIIYYYGCKTDNLFLRQLALTLMFVKIFRGRINKFWSNGSSDDTTTKYVLTNKLRNTNIARIHVNTFDAIIHIWVPRMDKKYWATVRDHPAHPLRGMVSILIAGWSRVHQAYKGLAKHYYKAFHDGIKTGSYTGDEDMEERTKLSKIEQNTDKVYVGISYMNNPIPEADKVYIKNNLNLKSTVVDNFESFIKNPKNMDEVKETIETFMRILKASNPQDIANINISMTADKLSGARSKDDFLKLKNQIDNSMRLVYGNELLSASPAQILKIRKSYILMYLLKIKQPYIKKDKYFETKTF